MINNNDLYCENSASTESKPDRKAPGYFRSVLNRVAQAEGFSVNINTDSTSRGYVVFINNEMFGPFQVQRKKEAVELASKEFLTIVRGDDKYG